MTNLVFDPFDEFQQFLAKLSFATILKDQEFVGASKKLHRRVLALLIVEYQFDACLVERSTELEAAAKPYLNEFRSDLLNSLLIFHLGLYKASMMTTRSAVENLLRVIAGCQGLDFRGCKSVFDLVELVKQSELRKVNSLFEDSLQTLLSSYGEFCDHVHSTGEEFLSMDRKLGDMPRWISKVGNERADLLVKVFQAATCVLLIMKPTVLQSMRHEQKDTVLDSLSRQMKSGLASGI